MPELPEVEVVRRGLADHVQGGTIAAAVVTGARVARRHLGGSEDLAARLTGRRVLTADRRGKYLWLVLDGEEALVVHLGMSGQLLVCTIDTPDPAHLHARLSLDDGVRELRFVDQRTFGGLALHDLVPDPHAPGGHADDAADHPGGIPTSIVHIAPDPWESAFDPAAVARRARSRVSGIKRLLLDQSLVSGIGNIYADESLWRAGVHGERPAAALTAPAVRRVLEHARDVMTEAVAQGGTSFDALYVNVNGASGYFDRRLHVYGQEDRPCDRCGTPIRREAFMNRSSYSCPRCQVRPRVRRAAPRRIR